jgi:ribonucleotide monophosphatase NagD (HAD superfamily)
LFSGHDKPPGQSHSFSSSSLSPPYSVCYPCFFEQALLSIGVAAHEAIMVGDDIENDIAGAQGAGLRGVLVCTGKHRADSPLLERVHPDALLPSIVDLPGWIEGHK